ncbi:MAG: hypothetical protein Sapg2KO_15210 [Saprospiraceae bacterium]
MLNQLRHILFKGSQAHQLLLGFGLITLCCFWLAIGSGTYALAGIPVALLVVYIAIVDFTKLFYLLIFCLPLSTEIMLPNGFGTDLPTEPLMVGLMGISLVFFMQKGPQLNARIFGHPITWFLLLHLSWVYFSTITSNLFFVSLKFSLAKTWYVVVFYFLGTYLLQDLKAQKRFFWTFFWPLVFTVVIIMIRHAGQGFSFVSIHKLLHPFQRNHVNYAAMLTLFVPFIWFAWRRQVAFSSRWYLLLGSIVLMVIAIYLSFTRAAYIALVLAVVAYFVFQLRLIRYLLLAGTVVAMISIAYVVQQNRYLEFAPNYETTVTHYEFDNLVEATYKMEDISTMERVYRWVAGMKMTPEEPWVGFGPGNFVNFYRSYTVTSFKTYISNNVDNSGVHSYFLMTLVEQGIIGLALFIIFSFVLLIKGERIFHQTKDPVRRGIVMSALLCLIVIDAFLLINDLIETDKVGPFLFLCAGFLVNIDFYNQDEQKKAATLKSS